MNFELLIENLTNPALLFFILGIFAVYVKSDLEIPPTSSKFISLYLLFAIGFKGGQSLKNEVFTSEIGLSLVFGVVVSILIPIYTFYLLKRRMSVYDAGAIAAAYGSVSAVTFITAASYLESLGLTMRGHMVAVMAIMEAPAIVVSLLLVRLFSKDTNVHTDSIADSGSDITSNDPVAVTVQANDRVSTWEIVKHSLTNGSVLLILGSLLIGYLADARQAEGLKPFTSEIFYGFLAIFLLDMGIISGRKLKSLFLFGWYPFVFAIIVPMVNGCLVGMASTFVTSDLTSQFIFAVLGASASYIAVPAAMKITVPKANPGLYLPMALAVTFPVNITVGMPVYLMVLQIFH